MTENNQIFRDLLSYSLVFVRCSGKRTLAGEDEDPGEDPLPPQPPGDAPDLPGTEVLEAAVRQDRYRRRLFRMIRTSVGTLITVAAVAVPYTGGPGTRALTVTGAVLAVSGVLGLAWRADKLPLRRRP